MEGSSEGIDLAPVTEMLTNYKEGVGEYVTAALPILAGIGLAVAAFFFAKLAFRMVKSWLSKAG